MISTLIPQLYQCLGNKKDVIIIRIIRREGSAPRGVGSCCMLDSDGKFYGTIGGGVLEHKAVQKARTLLADYKSAIDTINLSATEVAEEGMICGGEVELYYEPVSPSDEDVIKLFGGLVTLLQKGESGTLITRVSNQPDTSQHSTRMLVAKSGYNTANILHSDFQFPSPPFKAYLDRPASKRDAFFFEPVEQNPELLLFGGGHIARFVGPLAKNLGFKVKVFDDREDFANRKRFPDADEIHALPYKEALEQITITDSSYVVIVTRGHNSDQKVLEMLLSNDDSPGYIGMIGSVRKRNTLFNKMIESGVSTKALESVHCPIGLDIGAETPEEISISIIAEIIKVRAHRGKDISMQSNSLSIDRRYSLCQLQK